jgi:hypothetical protein
VGVDIKSTLCQWTMRSPVQNVSTVSDAKSNSCSTHASGLWREVDSEIVPSSFQHDKYCHVIQNHLAESKVSGSFAIPREIQNGSKFVSETNLTDFNRGRPILTDFTREGT